MEFNFYTAKIQIRYEADLLQLSKPIVEGKSIKNHYQLLLRSAHQTLLTEIKTKRDNFQLSDWNLFELVRLCSDAILNGRSSAEKNLLIWFCLSELGIDTRVTFRDQRVFVCVYTQDEIYEAPLIEDRGRTYVNISASNTRIDQDGVFLLDYVSKPNGRAFSFQLKNLLNLQPAPVKKVISFACKNENYSLEVELDLNWVRMLERYPLVDEREYLNAPLSVPLRASLLPALKKFSTGKTGIETLELITAFTRSAFKYKEDKEFFGRSKPMIPDELFHYAFSDCEDRSALFYALVKELLGWPMLIIGFPDHLTIAVSIPDFDGDGIEYQGRKYFFCDPTGPANSSEIGRLPEEFIGQEYEILGQFN